MAKKRSTKRQPVLIFLGLLLMAAGVLSIYMKEQQTIPELAAKLPTIQQTSQQDFAEKANQQLAAENAPTPLLLQTDERWRYDAYGDGDIAKNGCALLSLAMVLSHFRGSAIDPHEVFQWAGDRYFVTNSGTAWSIFPDFAAANNLTYHDLGDDFAQAQSFLSRQTPVIVSVVPGEFTDVGHIMVLSEMKDGKIRILDPADNKSKSHYSKAYTPEELQSQILHFWSYTQTP